MLRLSNRTVTVFDRGISMMPPSAAVLEVQIQVWNEFKVLGIQCVQRHIIANRGRCNQHVRDRRFMAERMSPHQVDKQGGNGRIQAIAMALSKMAFNFGQLLFISGAVEQFGFGDDADRDIGWPYDSEGLDDCWIAFVKFNQDIGITQNHPRRSGQAFTRMEVWSISRSFQMPAQLKKSSPDAG